MLELAPDVDEDFSETNPKFSPSFAEKELNTLDVPTVTVSLLNVSVIGSFSSSAGGFISPPPSASAVFVRVRDFM